MCDSHFSLLLKFQRTLLFTKSVLVFSYLHGVECTALKISSRALCPDHLVLLWDHHHQLGDVLSQHFVNLEKKRPKESNYQKAFHATTRVCMRIVTQNNPQNLMA